MSVSVSVVCIFCLFDLFVSPGFFFFFRFKDVAVSAVTPRSPSVGCCWPLPWRRVCESYGPTPPGRQSKPASALEKKRRQKQKVISCSVCVGESWTQGVTQTTTKHRLQGSQLMEFADGRFGPCLRDGPASSTHAKIAVKDTRANRRDPCR